MTMHSAARRTAPARAEPEKIVFTIVSKNYLHFARTLMESVARHAPDWKRVVLLVDQNRDEIDLAHEPFEVLQVGELPLPDPRKFCFRYTILELNTAVKPWMFEWLFAHRAADWVVYLDPDIYLYRPLGEVEQALARGATMVLTPHLTGHLDDGHRPHELDILKAGSYNLGFLAVRNHPAVGDFLRWWQRKLEFNCVVDHDNGFFVDQKWVDLAPGMYSDVEILRHEGYNVAYWNLAHRAMRRDGADVRVNDAPLVFYHFSGLDSRNPDAISKYQDRFRLSDIPALEELVREYMGRLRANGSDSLAALPYAFGTFTNGEAIPDCIRELYRKDPEFQKRAGADPFVLRHDYLDAPVESTPPGAIPITVLMRHVWSTRRELGVAFPRPFEDDRQAFVDWFVRNGASIGLPRSCIAPTERRLREAVSSASIASERAYGRLRGFEPMRSFAQLFGLNDAAFVMEAYQTVLGRPPDPGGLDHFLDVLRNGGSKAEVVWRLRYSAEGRARKTALPGLWRETWREHATALFGRGKRARAPQDRAAERVVRAEPRPPAAPLARETPEQVDWPAIAKERFGRAMYLGFYDWGDQHSGLVWMGRTAAIRLPSGAVGNVRIVGSYDADHQRRANGSPEIGVDVGLNDTVVDRFELRKSGAFDVSVRVPPGSYESPVFLTLTASAVFVPAAIGLSNDPRELSLRIARVEVDDRAIVDFSQLDSPYCALSRVSESEIGINVVGYLRSEHGVGESARLFAQSASAAGIPIALCDFNAGNSARAEDDSWASRLSRSNPHGTNVFHINADQMTLARVTLGEDFFRDRYNIGFWHWELPDFPDRFQSGFAFVDEIWAPSQFVVDSIGAKSPVPVVRMPHAVRFDVDASVTREQMGLPLDAFLFLTMYDMHSAQGRKNPHAVIDAYRRAFGVAHRVGLVVKVQNVQSCPDDYEELRRELADVPGVVLIDRTLTRAEIYALESLCDCFVSLHRSEGFGLGLAESMYLGKPVIGTNWSGNTDFMNPQNSCPVDYRLVVLDRDHGTYYKKGNVWADPDVEHAAWYMAALVREPDYCASLGAAGQRTIRSDFSPERVGARYATRLRVIRRW